MNKNDKKLNRLQEFFEDDPTNELPTLTEQAFATGLDDESEAECDDRFDPAGDELPDEGLSEDCDEDTGETPILRLTEDQLAGTTDLSGSPDTRILSIHRLEKEIQRLQSNWIAIEDDLRERDTAIEDLEQALANRADSIEDLEQALASRADSIEDLEQELCDASDTRAELEDGIDDLQTRLKAQAEQLDKKGSALELSETSLEQTVREFEAARDSLEKAQTEAAELQHRSLDHQQIADDRDQRTAWLESENRRLNTVLDDLKVYVDGRKTRWTDQESSMETLEKALSAKEEALKRYEREKAEFSATIQELREQADELSVLHKEYEKERHELRATLAVRTEEFESVTKELQEERQASEKYVADVDEHSQQIESIESLLENERQTVASLNDQINDSERTNRELSEALDAETTARQRINEDLHERDTRIAAIELGLAEKSAELLTMEEQRHDLEARVQKQQTDNAALELKLDDLESEKDTLRESLERQANAVKNLEYELHAKLETIAVIGHKVERLSHIEDTIHKLDERVFQESHDSDEREITRIMETVNGNRSVKYPLFKRVMVIGRSAGCDIQIRRQYISRRHARLISDNDGVIIEDIGSKNGILVNAQRVLHHRLEDGDIVDMGELQFRFIDLAEQQQLDSA
jgi:chromosome segregation ATPase